MSAVAIPFVIGVTGHRNISRVEEDRIRPILEELFTSHARDYPLVPLRLLSGLAEGADRIVAHVFLEVRDRLRGNNNNSVTDWELIATLPFSEGAYRDDFSDTNEEFTELLAAASSVVTVSAQTVADIRAKQELRVDGYEALGYYILRHSSLIIALWDGAHLDLRGGTSHVVRLRLQGVENTDSLALLHDCGPVFQIPVQRGEPSSSQKPGEPLLLFPVAQRNGADDLKTLKTSFAQFNAACARKLQSDDLALSLRYLSPPGEEGSAIHDHWLEHASRLDRNVINVFGAADVLASKLDNERLRYTRFLYMAGLALALALWTGLDKVAQGWMVAVYLSALAVIVAIYVRLKRHDLALGRLDYRLLAEMLRVQIYWRMLDGHENEPESDETQADAEMLHAMVLDGVLSQHALEMEWLREVLRLCGTDREPTRLSRRNRAQYLHHWIGDQYRYFAKTEQRYDCQNTMLRRASLAAVVAGVVAAACVVWIDQHELSETLRHFAAIAAASLPATVLLLESYRERMTIEDQGNSMARMKAVFGRVLDRLKNTRHDQMPPAGLIRALGQESLAESVSWLILRRSKPTIFPT
jgi:hypothetical protein